MPLYLTASEVEKRNRVDSSEITQLLLEGLQRSKAPPPPIERPANDDDDDDDSLPRHRRAAHQRAVADHRMRDRVGDMLSLPTGVMRKEIPMTEIMDMMNAQHDAVLKNPWFVRVTTNRQRVNCEYLLEHLDELLKQIPVRCKDFDLLPVQRLAIMCMVVAMPVETFTNCEIPREAMEELTESRRRKEPFDIRYCLEANALPTFTVADFCTGSGKTIMAVQAALVLLCCRSRWDALRASFRDVLSARVRETHSGLCKLNKLASVKLARLCIMFVPHNMMSHWHKTAMSAIFGAKETYGQALDVLLWKGKHRDHSMKNAYDSGKPVLWILALESESMEAVTRTPEIAYAARIEDELSSKMGTRYDKPQSVPLYSYITQATIETLESCCYGAPRHPLRLAMGDNFKSMRDVKIDMKYADYKAVQQALEHYCKISQFAAPEFVRRLVAEGVQAYMPRGIVVHKVPLRCGTLAAIARGSDMVRLSLPDLASQLLDGKVSEAVRLRIKALFERADVFQTTGILEELTTELSNMPPAVTLSDHHAHQAVVRLKDRLADLFGGTLPDCPISLEPIPRERVRILKCCTAILDSESIPGCRNRCPLCRGPIETVTVNPEPKAEPPEEPTPPEADGKRPAKQQKLDFSAKPQSKLQALNKRKSSDSDDSDLSGDEGPDDDPTMPRNEGREPAAPERSSAEAEAAFEARIAAIASACPYSVDGVLDILAAQIELQPTSRILLCFGFQASQRENVRRITARIRNEIAGSNVTDIEQCRKDSLKFDGAKAMFDDRQRYPAPQVFIINTTEESSSVQGLDLVETDLIVIADHCSVRTQRQALGRGLRMQRRPKKMKKGELFPAKRVVVASIGNNRPAAVGEASASAGAAVAANSQEDSDDSAGID